MFFNFNLRLDPDTWRRVFSFYRDAAQPQLDRIEAKLTAIAIQQQELNMTFLELKAKVTEAVTVENSAVALITGIATQLKEAIAAGTDPAEIQAVADQLDAGTAALTAAVLANTPAAPPAPSA